MGGESGPTIGGGIIHLEDQGLVAAHPGKVIPAVGGTVGNGVGLANAVRVPALHLDQVGIGEALRVANRQRLAQDVRAYGTPDLGDHEAGLQQALRLLRQQIPDTLGAGPVGVIVVNLFQRLAHAPRLLNGVAGTGGVVKNMDPGGTGHLLDQRRRFGVIDGFHFFQVVKIRHRGGMVHKHKAMPLEVQVINLLAPIVDFDPALIEHAIQVFNRPAQGERRAHGFHPRVKGVANRSLYAIAHAGCLIAVLSPFCSRHWKKRSGSRIMR